MGVASRRHVLLAGWPDSAAVLGFRCGTQSERSPAGHVEQLHASVGRRELWCRRTQPLGRQEAKTVAVESESEHVGFLLVAESSMRYGYPAEVIRTRLELGLSCSR